MSTVVESVPQQEVQRDASPTNQPQLEGEELMKALVQQVDFYFSKANLATDAYLVSQMNAQGYVPVDVIAGFPKVRNLTSDASLVLSAMQRSKNCSVDMNARLVRSTAKSKRNTLILRDIPSDTDANEVKAIFDFEKCPGKVANIRPDIGDTWFVTFETEAQCQETAMALIGRTFKGKPIKARIKSESVVRGFYIPQQQSYPQKFNGQPSNNGQWSAPANGFYGVPGQQQQPMYNNWNQYEQYQQYGQYQGWQGQAYGDAQYQNRRGGAKKGGPSTRGGKQGERKSGRGKKGDRRRVNGQGDTRGPQAGRRPRQSGASQPPLGPEHFPALPNARKDPSSGGYTRPFQKYSREEIVGIIAGLADTPFPKPATFPSEQECPILRDEAVTKCQLNEPFPVMFPASPSPLLEAQPKGAGAMPEFDLGSSFAATKPNAIMKSRSRPGASSNRASPQPRSSESPAVKTLKDSPANQPSTRPPQIKVALTNMPSPSRPSKSPAVKPQDSKPPAAEKPTPSSAPPAAAPKPVRAWNQLVKAQPVPIPRGNNPVNTHSVERKPVSNANSSNAAPKNAARPSKPSSNNAPAAAANAKPAEDTPKPETPAAPAKLSYADLLKKTSAK